MWATILGRPPRLLRHPSHEARSARRIQGVQLGQVLLTAKQGPVIMEVGVCVCDGLCVQHHRQASCGGPL
eukprot:1393037-Amphidinium_carterae.2